jgi:hypothetical protein
MRTLFILLAAIAASPARADVTAYDVVWDSPSQDSWGSMPLGNGDIGVNLWVEHDGDLLFYVSKTDAWSENDRLLKLTRVRVSIEPSPFDGELPFRQSLRLREGTIAIEAGEPGDTVVLRSWVDANNPIVCVEGEFDSSRTVTVEIEPWRTERREIAGAETVSAWGLDKGPDPIVVEPDVIVERSDDRLLWYHRNERSIWTRTLTHQGLGKAAERLPDPLLNRTFGGLIEGSPLRRMSPTRLATPEPTRTFSASVYALTSQTKTADDWIGAMERIAAGVAREPMLVRRAAHRAWWEAFWDRHRIEISAPDEPIGVLGGDGLEFMDGPLRIGADSDGHNRFTGFMRRVSVFSRALTPDEIAKLAMPDARSQRIDGALATWRMAESDDGNVEDGLGRFEATVVGDVAFMAGASGEPRGRAGHAAAGFHDGYLEVHHDEAFDLSGGFTFEAWIAPGALPAGGGRIIDKCIAGTDTGFTFDTYPGNSLRLITSRGIATHKANLPEGEWTHVAATYDPIADEHRLYVNGDPVTSYEPRTKRDVASAISRGYALQRFINACAGRGDQPIKFNGSIFNVDLVGSIRGRPAGLDADFRDWGGSFWWQNTRLPYWSMLACGDFEMMDPLFAMYTRSLPLAMERTRTYFGHAGAYWPETQHWWGAWGMRDYGWDRDGWDVGVATNPYIQYEWQGGIELVAMMLDRHAHTEDASFARETLVPIATRVVAFYDEHFARDEGGRLHIWPAQALETWWQVPNPAPEIAGLRWILTGLLGLPERMTDEPERDRWRRLLRELPDLPMREIGGVTVIAPAAELGNRTNIENPELYPVFPYRQHVLGTPGEALGRRTFERRTIKQTGGWHQDAIHAAMLGLTDEAARDVVSNFTTHHEGSRFPAFWGPNYDWVPDQDHGTVAMIALQRMLVQSRGERILLFPAWPREWDVSFRVHAPGRTVIEGELIDGELVRLEVSPRARLGDVVNLLQER